MFYDVAAISYAIHLLEKSRYFSFFQALARRAHYMLVIRHVSDPHVLSLFI